MDHKIIASFHGRHRLDTLLHISKAGRLTFSESFASSRSNTFLGAAERLSASLSAILSRIRSTSTLDTRMDMNLKAAAKTLLHSVTFQYRSGDAAAFLTCRKMVFKAWFSSLEIVVPNL